MKKLSRKERWKAYGILGTLTMFRKSVNNHYVREIISLQLRNRLDQLANLADKLASDINKVLHEITGPKDNKNE